MPYDVDDMIRRTREKTVKYFGKEIVFEYYVGKITKEFRAEAVRLMRLAARLQRKRNELVQAMSEAEDQALKGEMDDAAIDKIESTMTDELLKEFEAEDDRVKRAIDAVVVSILASWDLTKKGEPYPITLENMYPIDAEFESAMISEIMADSTPLGEASGQRNVRPLPPTLKQKGLQVNSRRNRAG